MGEVTKMKKLVALFIVTLFTTSAFANFFGPRFFELEINVPFSVTNNAFMLDDIMQEQAVLDFGKIADSLPKSGFTVLNTIDPTVGLNINLGDLSAGASVGLDMYQKYNLSKDFFDFIGKGNKLNEEMKFAMNFNLDVFYDYSAYIELPFGDLRIKVAPTVFTPLIHITTEDSGIVVNNTDDGKLIVDFNATGKMYTYTDFQDPNSYYPGDGYGFDLGASVEVPIFDSLSVTGNIRTPIAPGHLSYVSSFSVEKSLEAKLLEFTNIAGMDFKPAIDKQLFEETSLAINRPLKLNAIADMAPMGNFLHLYGGGGIGVRNPFSKKIKAAWYPEYYFGCCVRAGGFASCTASTEYTDQLFKHSLEGTLNLRIFELDMGLAFASSSFASSFRGAGFAAYVTTKWGF